jgi:hypothetical protein
LTWDRKSNDNDDGGEKMKITRRIADRLRAPFLSLMLVSVLAITAACQPDANAGKSMPPVAQEDGTFIIDEQTAQGLRTDGNELSDFVVITLNKDGQINYLTTKGVSVTRTLGDSQDYKKQTQLQNNQGPQDGQNVFTQIAGLDWSIISPAFANALTTLSCSAISDVCYECCQKKSGDEVCFTFHLFGGQC